MDCSLGSSFDMLIAAGHGVQSIRGYTLKQMQKFVSLFKTRSMVLMRDTSIAVRAAHHADTKGYKEFLESTLAID